MSSTGVGLTLTRCWNKASEASVVKFDDVISPVRQPVSGIVVRILVRNTKVIRAAVVNGRHGARVIDGGEVVEQVGTVRNQIPGDG